MKDCWRETLERRCAPDDTCKVSCHKLVYNSPACMSWPPRERHRINFDLLLAAGCDVCRAGDLEVLKSPIGPTARALPTSNSPLPKPFLLCLTPHVGYCVPSALLQCFAHFVSSTCAAPFLINIAAAPGPAWMQECRRPFNGCLDAGCIGSGLGSA